MKRLIIAFTVLIAFATGISAQARETLGNGDIAAQWRTKSIKVKNGGKAPSVVTLLKAFQENFPTWVVGEILNQNDHPVKGTKRNGSTLLYENNDNDEFRMLIDPGNGYIELSSMTDINQMSACVWRCDNGHRVFAVTIYMQHDPVQHLLCWYDYDPQTQTMKPEKSPLDEFKPDASNAYIMWNLPKKGTDFTITEYYPSLPRITHVYKWDRKQFNEASTQLPDFKYKLAADSEAFQRLSESGYGWSHYCLLDLTGEGSPILAFCNFYDGEIGEMMLIGEYKGDHVSLGMKTPDGEKLNVFRLPDREKNGDKRIAVVHRDMVGGLFYNIISGGYVQYLVCDLPNFANPEEGRTIKKTAGFGSNDETTDIISQLGEWIDLSKYWRWSTFDIIEGEEE